MARLATSRRRITKNTNPAIAKAEPGHATCDWWFGKSVWARLGNFVHSVQTASTKATMSTDVVGIPSVILA
jgi:hypothetical protein